MDLWTQWSKERVGWIERVALSVCVYIYTHTYTHTHIYIYISNRYIFENKRTWICQLALEGVTLKAQLLQIIIFSNLSNWYSRQSIIFIMGPSDTALDDRFCDRSKGTSLHDQFPTDGESWRYPSDAWLGIQQNWPVGSGCWPLPPISLKVALAALGTEETSKMFCAPVSYTQVK